VEELISEDWVGEQKMLLLVAVKEKICEPLIWVTT
jgi:hypothetical protein